MKQLILPVLLLISGAFSLRPDQQTSYMFIMLRPIPACEGKCNNYELLEYPERTEEACKAREDSCRAKYGDKPEYITIAPGEGAVYYKYNKFVAYCDCKILGVHKSSSVEKAREEMMQKVEAERVKKPKAFHNFEIYKTWPR